MRGGIDKGFCVNYWRLSYRRKFLRDLWVGALVCILLVVLSQLLKWENLGMLLATLFAVGLVSAGYNYRQWQAERWLAGLLADGAVEAWRQVAVVVDGVDIQAGRATFLFVNEEAYTVTVNGKTYQTGTSTLVDDSGPCQSDVTVTEGPDAGSTILQIFQVDGDVLYACAARAGEARPTEFTSEPGRGHTLSVWIRVK